MSDTQTGHDVIVVGGSYAGMAAALQLVRAHRRVLVIDGGRRRNRAAAHAHGFLGQDGVDPTAIAATARLQLEAYPTLTWHDDEAVEAGGEHDDFHVETRGGHRHRGRRLLFATGVSDTLPPVEGLAERWGISVFACPYCHGYELGRGRIGVVATGPMSIHQAQLLPEWGTVTFLLNGALELDDVNAQELAGRGVAIESTPIARIDGHADVVLADGRRLPFAGLFTAPRNGPATPVAERMGCALVETPTGTQIQTDDAKQTRLRGVYACGDAARMPHTIALAVADGAWAGAQLHRSLVWPEA
ncbi:NAD(P)/FAD-dependent oxidoreductase [Marilutibacter chinensis]|uniref:NAD(P)/FAD-dependent oxidoreductase n=1 Tax=Marilutibacter chinensis TaxID=2912247 RepID=A0ABS9HRC6_9GAMM|nr:NAD(P)/FAD-dependent oxidoreductase [Lysobacter chinensis]MCF7221500.1 NAD(P)/FAD-dependent oxidoreductase [Lysobacter chinensis]